jgi:hypothetical protein
MAKEYSLSDVTSKIGPKHGSYIYDITFVDVETLEVLMCVVDESFRNYTRSGWNNLLAGDIPYGIYTGLRRKSKQNHAGIWVIDADSYPMMTAPLTETEVIEIIEIRQAQLTQPK